MVVAVQGIPVPFNATIYAIPFLIIAALALWGLKLACETQPYSLLVTHWTFIFFFLALAPMVQFWHGKFPPQADLGYFGEYHFHASAVVIAWEIVVLLTYRRPPPSAAHRTNVWLKLVPRPFVLVLLSFGSFAALVVVLGPGALLARSEIYSNYDRISPALLIVATMGRAIPLIVAVIACINWKQKSFSSKLLGISLCLVAFAVNFPTSVARFWIGGIAVGLVCLYMSERRKNGLWLPVMFLVAFLLVMPLLGTFRRVGSGDLLNVELTAPDFATVPLRGDFDNYIMLVDSAGYLAKNEPTYGVSLVGNLLFFVPRSIWPDKAGSTRDLFIQGTALEKINGNVANSLLAEGIINFGWLGVALYAYLFARICKAIDALYWTTPKKVSRFQTGVVVCYPFLVGFMVYFLRGSFVPALSSTTAFCASVLLTTALGTKNMNLFSRSNAARFTPAKSLNPDPEPVQ